MNRARQVWQRLCTRAARGQRGVVILALLAITCLAALLMLGGLVLWHGHDLPPIDKATDYRPRQHLQVLTADGVEIAQFGTERRVFVAVADMPKLMKEAVLAVEDWRFYEHGGISWPGLTRAVLANLSGGTPQGASTITQQVARTMFLSTRRTVERKIKEALLSWQLEGQLNKDQILELYLNQIYLGQRAYGFGAAALAYFGKPLATLSVAETAMLAGLPQNPIYANPLANMGRASKRQRWVLQRMLTVGVINQATHDAALVEKLVYRRGLLPGLPAQHAADMARRAVVERLGEQAYTEGIRVTTSLRADDQRAAHAALRRAVIAHERKQPWAGPEEQTKLPDDPAQAERAAALFLKDLNDDDDLRAAMVLAASPQAVRAQLASGDVVTVKADTLTWLASALAPNAPPALAIRRGSVVRLYAQPVRKPAKAGAPAATEWVVTQWPKAEAAFVAMDPSTGRVRALVGGFDFGEKQFNRVTSAWRQPGSSFKPFLYSAALEHGVMPETLVDDAPLLNADGQPGSWDPRNSDGKFDGDMPMREGLVRSKNLVSIRILKQLGTSVARQWASHFGFDKDKHPSDLTLALGSGSVTPMQMAQAYAVFANGGHLVQPVLIERIVDARGKVLFQAPAAPTLGEDTRVIPARNAFLTNTLLRDVTARGTAARAQGALQRNDIYGKTGTTNDAFDAWFAGFHATAVGVAWMGYDNPRSLGEGETGGGLALPIWIEAMAQMLRGVPVRPLALPGGVVNVGQDLRYAEYAEGGFLERVGPPPAVRTDAAEPANGAASGVGR